MSSFSEARSLVERLNRYVEAQPALAKKLITDEYPVLHWGQTQAFYTFLYALEGRPRSVSDDSFKQRVKDGAMNGALFLVSFFSCLWFMLRRPDVLLYTIDKVQGELVSDFRMEGIYRFLRDHKLSYAEFVHAVPSRGTFERLKKRGRPVVFLKAFESLASCFVGRGVRAQARSFTQGLDLSSFGTYAEQVRALLTTFLVQADLVTGQIGWMRRVLRVLGTRILFTIDDVRNYNKILIACQAEQIPTYAFQHGHFTKYHLGWLALTKDVSKIVPPTKLFVWSDYWKRELLRLGTYFTQQGIDVGGPMKPRQGALPVIQIRDISARLLCVLLPYETDAPKAEVTACVLRLLASDGIKLIFKARPDMDGKKQLLEYGLPTEAIERIQIETDVMRVFDEVDVVLGTYSTFLYDMAILGKPVAYLKTTLDFGEALVTNDLADLVEETTSEGLKTRLMNIAQSSPEVLEARRNRLLEGEGDIKVTLARLLAERGIKL